jgi:8-oxo-dGTP diphosphatase
MEINIYPNELKNVEYKYVIIISKYNDQYIFVQHKKRETLEIPGGKIEQYETILDAAKRELWEETGAIKFDIASIFDYSIITSEITYGKIFLASIVELEPLNSKSEIRKLFFLNKLPENLTYNAHNIIFNYYLNNICLPTK